MSSKNRVSAFFSFRILTLCLKVWHQRRLLWDVPERPSARTGGSFQKRVESTSFKHTQVWVDSGLEMCRGLSICGDVNLWRGLLNWGILQQNLCCKSTNSFELVNWSSSKSFWNTIATWAIGWLQLGKYVSKWTTHSFLMQLLLRKLTTQFLQRKQC